MGNNRDIEGYQQSVRLEASPIVDVQSPAQQLINAFDSFSGVINTAETALAKNVVENQRNDIRNQIANDYQAFATSSMQIPDKQAAVLNYDKSSSQYAQRYLEQTHFWNRGYAKNMLDYFANVHRKPLLTAATQQTNRVMQDQASDYINNSVNQIYNAIQNSEKRIDPKTGLNTQFHEADALTADLFRSMKRFRNVNTFDKSAYEGSIPKLVKSFQQEKLIKGYNDALNQGYGQKFLDYVDKTTIPGFNQEEKIKLINGPFIQARNRYINSLGISTTHLIDQMNNELKNVENYGAIPSVPLQDAIRQARTKDEYLDFQKKLEISKAVWNSKSALSTLNPLQAQQYVDTFKPTNDKDPNYKYHVLLYNKVNNIKNSVFQELYKDPFEVTSQDPAVKTAIINYAVAKGVSGNFLSPLNTETLHPDHAIRYAQEARGLSLGGARVNARDTSVRFMTDAQAKTLVSQINNANPREVLNTFQQLKNQSANTSYYYARIQQLIRAGMPEGLSAAAGIDPTSPYASDVITALKTPLSGKGGLDEQMRSTDKGHKTTFDLHINNDVDSSPGIFSRDNSFKNYMLSQSSYSGGRSGQYADAMKSTLKNLGYYAMLNGIAKDPSDAAAWAENQIAGKYNYALLNGNKIRVPNEYTVDNIVGYANLMAEKVKDMNFITSSSQANLLSKSEVQNIDKNIILQGHWANDALDNGLVWVDRNGKPPKDANGNYFRISFEEANNWHDTKEPILEFQDRMNNALLGLNKKVVPSDIASSTKGKFDELDSKSFIENSPHIPEVLNKNIPSFGKINLDHFSNERDGNDISRGLRNNNPGNIKKTASKWKGEIEGEDKTFKTFQSPEDGIKAMSSLLSKYASKGVNTIESLVRRWSNTDQNQYIKHVAEKLGQSPNEALNLKDKNTRSKVINALIEFENGRNPYSSDLIERSV